MAPDPIPAPKLRQKSYRRKYNKIRHKFKAVFDKNTELHEEEQRLVKILRRLQEQNDQLLDLLLDINESKRIPRHLSYSLATPPPEPELPDPQADGIRQRALDLFRKQLESGEIPQHDYEIAVAQVESELRKDAPPPSLQDLEKAVSHTSLNLLNQLSIVPLPDNIKDEEFNTYLDASHEDSYLAALDAQIDGIQPIADNQAPKLVLSEMSWKNPVSIYNWLKTHKPDVFVQEGGGGDKDKQEEKEAKASASAVAGIKRESRAIKRASVAELLDDDGNVVGGFAEPAPAPTKSKRKRDDDAYRPKGGGSGGTKKRKKSTGKIADAE